MKIKAIATAVFKLGWLPQKFLLVMKLTIFILIITLLQVSAKGFSQKVTLNVENMPLENVLQSIEKQSGYLFIYKDIQLKGKVVNVQIKDKTVEEALNACLQNLQLRFEIFDKNIVISKKPETVFEKIGNLLAGPKTVKGHVIDSLGKPLIGATVQLQGEQMMISAAISDEFGNFKFEKYPQALTISRSRISATSLSIK